MSTAAVMLATAINNTATGNDFEDTRRITEDDPDFQRLHSQTVARLQRSLRHYARALQRGEPGADTRFIDRHENIIKQAYEAAHREGQKDYWPAVSNRKIRHRYVPPPKKQVQERMAWYALPSVMKMAHEVKSYVQQQQSGATGTTEPLEGTLTLDDAGTGDDSLLPGGFDNRTVLQADITWSGLNDGYSAAGASDSASPYSLLYWNLGEAKNHCFDCPNLAFGSPYDPPWYGAGSNQLTQTPGDGQTECGAACKCSLSYEYPDATGLDQLGQQIADKWNDWLPSSEEGDIAAGGAGAPFLPNPAPGQPRNPVRINRGQAPPLPRRIDRLSPPARGATLTTDQKAALDDFRNSTAMWDTIRRQLPPAPSLFGVDDLPAPLPAWDLLSPEQQAVVTRIEQAQEKWLSASAALVPPPHFSPDPAVAVGQWLDAVAKADWPVPGDEAQSETAMMKWLDSVAKQDWPVPDTPNYDAEMQAFLDRAARQFREWVAVEATIKLYNPNHDAKGRFTYGSGGAKTVVAKGQGKTIRGEGGKRMSNAAKIENYGHARQDMNRVFGRRVTNDQVRTMMQAGRGDTIHVEENYNENSVAVRLVGPRGIQGEDIASLEFSRLGGGGILATGDVGIEAGSRSATSGRQVLTGLKTMSDMGVTRFDMYAGRFPGQNGYDTWARLGATGDIPRSALGTGRNVLAEAQARFGNVTRVEQIMALPGGAKWWKANGDTWEASFNLTPGSSTMGIINRLLGG